MKLIRYGIINMSSADFPNISYPLKDYLLHRLYHSLYRRMSDCIHSDWSTYETT